MARPKKLINRMAVVTNISESFKLHLDEVARRISKESGHLITVSELIRIALERVYPLVTYEYLYQCEWPNKKGEPNE